MKNDAVLGSHRIAVQLMRAPRQLLVLLVRTYRLLLSPWLGSGCRFEPTCSVYSIGALERHGALAGSYLTLHRLVRCQPWCEGGHDPVPASLGPKARSLFPFARSSDSATDRFSSSEKTSS
jgi:uncharacterized protein